MKLTIPKSASSGGAGSLFGPVTGSIKPLPVPNIVTGANTGAQPGAGPASAGAQPKPIQTGAPPLTPQSTAAEKATGMPMEMMQAQQQVQEMQGKEQQMQMQTDFLKQQLQLSKAVQQAQTQAQKNQPAASPSVDPEQYRNLATTLATRTLARSLKQIEKLQKDVRTTPLKLKMATTQPRRPAVNSKTITPLPPRTSPMNIHTGTPLDPDYDPKLKQQLQREQLEAGLDYDRLRTQNAQIQATIGDTDKWYSPIGTMAGIAGAASRTREDPNTPPAGLTAQQWQAMRAAQAQGDRSLEQQYGVGHGEMDPSLRLGAITDLFSDEANEVQRQMDQPMTQHELFDPAIRQNQNQVANAVSDMYQNNGGGVLFNNTISDPQFGNVGGFTLGRYGDRADAYGQEMDKRIAARNAAIKPGEEWRVGNLMAPISNALDRIKAMGAKGLGEVVDAPFNMGVAGVGNTMDMSDNMSRIGRDYDAGGFSNVNLRDVKDTGINGLMAALNLSPTGLVRGGPKGRLARYGLGGLTAYGAHNTLEDAASTKNQSSEVLQQMDQARQGLLPEQQQQQGGNFDWSQILPLLMMLFGNGDGSQQPQQAPRSPSYSPSSWSSTGVRY